MENQSSRSAYEVLEVSPLAGMDEIARAYRKLALKYHPDCNADSTVFCEITDAYNALKSDRVAYDMIFWLSHQRCKYCMGAGTVIKTVTFTQAELSVCGCCQGKGVQ